MRNLINLLLTLLLTISAESVLGQQNREQEQQTPSDASSNAAVQSVSCCLVKTNGSFTLMTETDSYPIETENDLSQYVNKQLKVTGILEHHTGTAPSATSGNAALITDIRLRMVAKVIGDCNQPSK